MQKFQELKAYFGKKDWEHPIVESDNIKNQYHGDMIYTGREMVNAMGLKDKEYLSEKGLYFPKDAYDRVQGFEFLKSKYDQIQIKPGTVKYYEALSKGTFGRIRRKPKLPPISAANRIREADRIKSLRDKSYTLDLAEYQSLLADPKTAEQAKEELLFIKALIEDAAKTDLAILEEKIHATGIASKSIGFIGLVFGAASGLASIGAVAQKAVNVAQGAAGQALKITETVVNRIGQAGTAIKAAKAVSGIKTQQQDKNKEYEEKVKKLNRNTTLSVLKTSTKVALKTASLILLGVAANLTAPGATITALAIVTTVIKGGLNVYKGRLEKKNMALRLNKSALLNTIDEMIKNNGTIFYKEDNPIFKTGLELKTKIDTIVNTQENYKIIDEVAQLENGTTAAALLDDMMANASNPNYDELFERNLLKSKEIEKVNNATIQKLRDRRAKLKRLYNTYKKPAANANIVALAQSVNTTGKPNEVVGGRRKTHKKRRT